MGKDTDGQPKPPVRFRFLNETAHSPPGRRVPETLRRRSRYDWEPYREMITKLYWTEKKTQQEVLETLVLKEGFHVSPSQLKHKLREWGDSHGKKNRPSRERRSVPSATDNGKHDGEQRTLGAGVNGRNDSRISEARITPPSIETGHEDSDQVLTESGNANGAITSLMETDHGPDPIGRALGPGTRSSSVEVTDIQLWEAAQAEPREALINRDHKRPRQCSPSDIITTRMPASIRGPTDLPPNNVAGVVTSPTGLMRRDELGNRNNSREEPPTDSELGPIHTAARLGNLKTVEALVRYDKTIVNQTTGLGWTALHFSAREGHLDVARFLIEQGADIGIQNNSADTPLVLAAREGHVELGKTILLHDKYYEAGAKPDALLVAVANSHDAFVFMMLDELDRRGSRDDCLLSWRSGWTPLHEATRKMNLAVATRLLGYGASANAAFFYQRRNGVTREPLHPLGVLLVQSFQTEQKSRGQFNTESVLSLAQTLLNSGAKISVGGTSSAKERTLLHMAAGYRMPHVLRLLLQSFRGGINQEDKYGLTPLHYATKYNCSECVSVLSEHGALLDGNSYADSASNPPLMLAILEGNIQMVRVLLEKGASPNIRNRLGETPLVLASMSDSSDEITLLLLEHRADPRMTVQKPPSGPFKDETAGFKEFEELAVDISLWPVPGGSVQQELEGPTGNQVQESDLAEPNSTYTSQNGTSLPPILSMDWRSETRPEERRQDATRFVGLGSEGDLVVTSQPLLQGIQMHADRAQTGNFLGGSVMQFTNPWRTDHVSQHWEWQDLQAPPNSNPVSARCHLCGSATEKSYQVRIIGDTMQFSCDACSQRSKPLPLPAQAETATGSGGEGKRKWRKGALRCSNCRSARRACRFEGRRPHTFNPLRLPHACDSCLRRGLVGCKPEYFDELAKPEKIRVQKRTLEHSVLQIQPEDLQQPSSDSPVAETRPFEPSTMTLPFTTGNSLRIPPEQWEAKKSVLHSLYQVQGKSLREVKHEMEVKHGFAPS